MAAAKRVHFKDNLNWEWIINEEGDKFARSFRMYVDKRRRELRGEEDRLKREQRARVKEELEKNEAEKIMNEFRLGACVGGEVIPAFPMLAGSHREHRQRIGEGRRLEEEEEEEEEQEQEQEMEKAEQRQQGGEGGGCFKTLVCGEAEEQRLEGERLGVRMDEAGLLNRSFDQFIIEFNGQMHRSKGRARVAVCLFLSFLFFCTFVMLCILFSLRR